MSLDKTVPVPRAPNAEEHLAMQNKLRAIGAEMPITLKYQGLIPTLIALSMVVGCALLDTPSMKASSFWFTTSFLAWIISFWWFVTTLRIKISSWFLAWQTVNEMPIDISSIINEAFYQAVAAHLVIFFSIATIVTENRGLSMFTAWLKLQCS